MHLPDATLPPGQRVSQRDRLLRRGLALEYVTCGWNIIGVVVVFCAAVSAQSVALKGFALDSLVEIGASTVVVWQLSDFRGNRECRALRLISGAFFALASYILGLSGWSLLRGIHAKTSLLGLVWLSLTLV